MHLFALLGAPTPFDPACAYVTSHLVSPGVLAVFRLTVAFYTLFVLLFTLIWQAVRFHTAKSFFSYFTELSYIGLCAYFWASGVQTLAYAIRLKGGDKKDVETGGKVDRNYPLQSWPRVLQFLHVLLQTTVATFPFIVTIVFWALLSSSDTFSTQYSSWSNISVHALNSVFALLELCLAAGPHAPWSHIPLCVILLGCYLGVAYITHATQGFYTYSFLDPHKQGSLLAAYIVGIAVGEVIMFLIFPVAFVTLRNRLLGRKARHRPTQNGTVPHDTDESHELGTRTV